MKKKKKIKAVEEIKEPETSEQNESEEVKEEKTAEVSEEKNTADTADTTDSTNTIAVADTAESKDVETAPESDAADDNTEKKQRKCFGIFAKISVIAACIAVIVSVAAIVFINVISRPMTFELGTEADFQKIRGNPLVSSVCKIEKTDIDMDKIGAYTAELNFFGFISRKMTVNVIDTMPPEVELYNISVSAGSEVECTDFVRAASDLTELKYSFAGDVPDFSKTGETEVSVSVTDTSGNVATKKAKLTVLDESYSFSFEYGDDTYLSAIREKYNDLTDEELSHVNTGKVGRYTVEFVRGDTYNVFNVVIKDTLPPVAEVKTLAVRPGKALQVEDVVVSVTDESEVSVGFEEAPALDTQGIKEITVVFEDSNGNSTRLQSHLCVIDIPEEVTLERGFTKEELEAELFKNLGDIRNEVSVDEAFDVSKVSLGDNELKIVSGYGELTVILKVIDTTKPFLQLRERTTYVGIAVSAKAFVYSCTDASPVEISFASAPSVYTAGSFPVTVVAKDSSGNTTKGQTYLHVIQDSVPPVIYGVKDISVLVGASVSYKSGVYAVDDISGNVVVNVDSSSVNLSEEGTYVVTYSASDASGNKTVLTANIKVSTISYDLLYSMADQILSSITNSSMSPKERAWAVYSWVTSNIKYSTSTSYLMGNFLEGAYSGFTTKRGNCYIYYAVTRIMLTRAGIENIEIHRNNPSDPHYWNLVNINGEWYHIDTCPQYAGHKMTVFLLTDEELRVYSENEVEGYYSFDESAYPDTP